MFRDFVDEAPWAGYWHRSGTTLVSFALQTIAVGLLLLLPLFYTQALPQVQWIEHQFLTPPPGPVAAPPRVRTHAPNILASNMAGRILLAPQHIPSAIAILNETEVPPPIELPGDLEVQGGTGGPAARNPVWNSIGTGLNPALPPAPIAPRPLRVSHMMEGNLIHRVQPEYPLLARQARIQGTVVLSALINRNGRIENLQVLSGHPMLMQAAMDAVRRWRYRPYYLNDQPVEVETRITVNFTLSGGQ